MNRAKQASHDVENNSDMVRWMWGCGYGGSEVDVEEMEYVCEEEVVMWRKVYMREVGHNEEVGVLEYI